MDENEITLPIPVHIWEYIRHFEATNFSLVNLSDEEIELKDKSSKTFMFKNSDIRDLQRYIIRKVMALIDENGEDIFSKKDGLKSALDEAKKQMAENESLTYEDIWVIKEDSFKLNYKKNLKIDRKLHDKLSAIAASQSITIEELLEKLCEKKE